MPKLGWSRGCGTGITFDLNTKQPSLTLFAYFPFLRSRVKFFSSFLVFRLKFEDDLDGEDEGEGEDEEELNGEGVADLQDAQDYAQGNQGDEHEGEY